MAVPTDDDVPDVTEDPVAVLAELLARAARAIHVESRALLAPMGLTPAAARTLRALARSEQPLRMVDLAERLHVVPRTVTTVVDALEAEQLVERRAAPHDRRSTYVHLTPLAHERLRQMRAARSHAASQLLSGLDGNEQTELRRLLERIAATVGDEDDADGELDDGR